MNTTRSYATHLATPPSSSSPEQPTPETHARDRAAPPGVGLIRALVAHDLDAAHALLAPDITFSALLPPRTVDLDERDTVLELFAGWFPAGHVDELHVLETGIVVDRHRIGYRVRWHSAAGERFVFEQQAYYDFGDAGISWMHLVCTGHRPLPTSHE